MTGPTHIAINIFAAYSADAGVVGIIACIVGALLPDIDHPQSAVGRSLFFISNNINRRFGHRKVIHGRPFWGTLLIVSFFIPFTWLKWVFIGCLIHCLADELNKPGVQTWQPFSDKTCVVFRQSWRVYNGSGTEYLILTVFVILISLTWHVRDIGGIRAVANRLSGAHEITVQELARAGQMKCFVKGTFRYTDGRIEDVNWLAVGIEKKESVVCFDGKKLVRNDRDGHFLSSHLVRTKEKNETFNMSGFAQFAEPVFFLSGGKWHYAEPGTPVIGSAKKVN